MIVPLVVVGIETRDTAQAGRREKLRRLIGNRRRDAPADTARRNNDLMTVRQDLLSMRKRLLAGDDEAALFETDTLLDNIENRLAEGC